MASKRKPTPPIPAIHRTPEPARSLEERIERVESVEALLVLWNGAEDGERHGSHARAFLDAFKSWAIRESTDRKSAETAHEEAEERIEKLEQEAAGEDDRIAEAVKEAREEDEDGVKQALEEATSGDITKLAAWCFSLGADLADVQSNLKTDEGREAARVAYLRSIPSMPQYKRS